MDNNPLISICIPVYNGEKDLFRAIESCINQTYKNIEIIISDDDSKDKTEKIALDYAAKDKRIKYFKNENNFGVVKNFLNAFKLASGEFVQLLNHDDWLSKNYIEEGVRKFNENPKAAAIISKLISMEEKSNNGNLYFENFCENIFKSKNYSTNFYVKNSYKNIFGALFMLSLLKKKDLVESFSFLTEVMINNNNDITSQETKKYLQIGYGVDVMIPLKILTKYDFMVFTDKSSYIKMEKTQSLGKKVEFDYSKAIDIIGYASYLKACFEYIFRIYWIKNLFKMKIFIGAGIINSVIFGFIKNKLKLNYWQGAEKELLLFFQSYSFFEKIIVCLSFIPLLIIRAFKVIKRKLFPQGEFQKKIPKKFICRPIYFLNENCEFKIY